MTTLWIIGFMFCYGLNQEELVEYGWFKFFYRTASLWILWPFKLGRLTRDILNKIEKDPANEEE